MGLEKVKITQTDLVNQLLMETAEWLQRKGSTQWAEVLQGTDKHGLTTAIQKEEVYFYFNEEKQLVGLFAAWEQPAAWDLQLWEKQPLTDSAVYIHRLIVRPDYHGQGYGEQLIDEIKRFFQSTVKEIRLDCLASNQQLIAFYKNNAFTTQGTGKDLSNTRFELFSYFFK